MSEFSLKFGLDNAAFAGDDLAKGIADVLRKLAGHIEEQSRSYLGNNGSRMRITDLNGNGIGFAHFELDDKTEEESREDAEAAGWYRDEGTFTNGDKVSAVSTWRELCEEQEIE